VYGERREEMCCQFKSKGGNARRHASIFYISRSTELSATFFNQSLPFFSFFFSFSFFYYFSITSHGSC